MPLAPQEQRTFLATFVTAQRRRIFQVTATAELFLSVMAAQREHQRMLIHAFVLMPDHVHMILTPAPEVSHERAVQFLKGGFSFQLKSKLSTWQESFYQTRLHDTIAYDASKSYVEQNPVRARMVLDAKDYPWSSAARPESVDPAPEWFHG